MNQANHHQAEDGTVIGPYKILQLIGEGGFGSVYMAEQQEPVRRTVALKIIKLGMDTKQVIARFEAERQALAMMDHPNIAKVFDAGATETGRPFFVMELVKGIPITEYCDKNKLVPRERLELFIRVCKAVQHAHQKGIIHRDIKPTNVMVTLHDGAPVPKVIDFGIAKATNQRLTEKTVFTEYSQFIGTPAYMSPEQAEMSGLDIDTRSDIYSLGVLLYELLTGTTPFDPRKLKSVAYDEIQRVIREVEPAKPSTRLGMLGDELPGIARSRGADPRGLTRLIRGDLDWIAVKALEKDRTRRYETANGMAMDIQRHLDNEPVVASPPGAVYRLHKFVRRHRAVVTAGALAGLALLIGLAVASIGFVRASHERDRAFAAENDALEQRDLAEKSRIEAVEARDESEAVTNFLTQMLAALNPGEMGKDVTVRQVLDEASKEIGAGFAERPMIETRLRDTIGRAYRNLGLYRQAEPHVRLTYEIHRRIMGPDHPYTLSAMNNLALLYRRQGRFDEAEPLYVKTLEIRRSTLGTEDPKTITSMNNLAMLYKHQGRYDEAEPLFIESLDALRRVHGEEHPHTITTINNLSGLYIKQGRLDKAEPMTHEVLKLRRRVLGEEHPDTINAMNNLAFLYKRKYQYEDAERTFLEALEISRRVLGDEHPQTLRMQHNLATTYVSQERCDEAEPLITRTLEMRIRIIGEEHPDTLNSMNCLGSIRQAQERFEESAEVHARALEIRRRILGEKHPDTLTSMNNLACCYQEQGLYEKAEELHARNHELRRSILGEEHPATLTSMINLAATYSDQDKVEQAEPLFAKLVESPRGKPGKNMDMMVRMLVNSSMFYIKTNKLAEAEPLAIESYELVKKRYGNGHERTTSTIKMLIQLYEAWEKPELAADWRTRLE